MAGEMVQVGTTVVVGLNGRTVGTWLVDSATEVSSSEVKEIRGANNSVVTKLISNPGRRYTVSGVLLSADLTTMEGAKIGDDISIDSVTCFLESVQLEFSREEAKCTVTAIKEDSMTYT